MLFVSTSGALGRYIDLPIPVTIGLRALLALFFLFLYCRFKGISLQVEKRHLLPVVTSGILMGLHWLTYFYALKLSNVAIGMISLFTYPILTAFLEPWLLKTKLQKVHLLLGLMVLVGIYFLVPNFDLKNNGTLAVIVGIFSALAYALRNIVLKTKVSDYNGSMLMSYQMGVVVVFLFPFMFTADMVEITSQWEAVVALAFMTTAVGHTMFINSFKHFSITTVSILSSIQPIFGITIGAFFLSEIPNQNTIIGGLLILGSVIIESIRTSRRQS
tara:strand:- start:21578 stop:22396 length:819 start_codon:yes stop_codon:yes gene_type:complete